jgi:hypothetical protein
MFIGVPKEIKIDEYRVGLTPTTVRELTARGHRVAVETMAGAGAGITDQEYIAAGAEMVTSAGQIFQRAELIVKVKEPLAPKGAAASCLVVSKACHPPKSWCSARRFLASSKHDRSPFRNENGIKRADDMSAGFTLISPSSDLFGDPATSSFAVSQ